MFIQTEATPNPNTLKFLPGRDVTGGAGRDMPTAEAAAAQSPLAAAAFAIDGVTRVYLGADFLTVTKTPEADWAILKPFLLSAIMDHFASGAPALSGAQEGSVADDIVYDGEAADIVAQIRDLIETRIRPAVARDGGDITFHSWDHEEGLVRLTMKGSCAGCPSSTITLKQGIENMLRHYVPEVNRVEQAL